MVLSIFDELNYYQWLKHEWLHLFCFLLFSHQYVWLSLVELFITKIHEQSHYLLNFWSSKQYLSLSLSFIIPSLCIMDLNYLISHHFFALIQLKLIKSPCYNHHYDSHSLSVSFYLYPHFHFLSISNPPKNFVPIQTETILHIMLHKYDILFHLLFIFIIHLMIITHWFLYCLKS